MKPTSTLLIGLALAFSFAGCGKAKGDKIVAELEKAEDAEEDHAHAEDPLGTIIMGEHSVELAQGHGGVVAGEESHLVVKLPYSDAGATVVRAWLGSSDRTLSFVGLGEYAASHDDYDIHAVAPDPLPENPMWQIELDR